VKIVLTPGVAVKLCYWVLLLGLVCGCLLWG